MMQEERGERISIISSVTLATILLSASMMFVLPSLALQTAHAESATIDVFPCKWLNDDGTQKDTVTYKIQNIVGADESVVNAIVKGVQEWDGHVHNIQQVDSSSDADVNVKIVKRLGSESAWGFGAIDCPNGDEKATRGVAVIGIRGPQGNLIGLQNVAAHEMGHALGVGHTSLIKDMMYTKQDKGRILDIRTDVICPSNLDVGALIAEGSTYSVDSWQKLNC